MYDCIVALRSMQIEAYPQVVSGGVASNQYLRAKLRLLLDHYGFTLYCPPPHLCTDNGVMIAWYGENFIK